MEMCPLEPAGKRFQCGQKLRAVHDRAVFIDVKGIAGEQPLPNGFIARCNGVEQRLIFRPQLLFHGREIRIGRRGLQGGDD